MLSYLRSPDLLAEAALASLFDAPNVPLAGLIIQQYFDLGANSVDNKTLEFLCLQYAPSFVFEFTTQNSSIRKPPLPKLRWLQAPTWKPWKHQERINSQPMLRLLHLSLSKVYLQPLQLSGLQPFHLQLFHPPPIFLCCSRKRKSI